MAAFEEVGVSPELIKAVEELGWTLPTPIQAEAVPLILGGGDVMAAAETGSGKTGAFALPVLQIVHEALRAKQQGKAAATGSQAGGGGPVACVLNAEDRDAVVAISPDGLRCQARSEQAWGGCRSALGAFGGKVYYEATVADEGLCRVGWSTQAASLDLGTDKHGFGFGGTGKKSHSRQFDSYGEPYGLNDTIGCLLNCQGGTIAFTKNGRALGDAFQLPQYMQGQALYPAISLKNAELAINFGSAPFRHPPPPGFVGLAQAPRSATASWQNVPGGDDGSRKPLAIILEPARDLAEQTHNNINLFRKYLAAPSLRSELLVGGTNPAQQLRSLREGVDIVVGTPGRVMDFIETGKLPADQVKFFVLDEADRLLDTGNRDVIMKMFRRFPKAGVGVARLQVLLFSATLHSPEVRALAREICQNPIVVDLKGKDAVPETVDHVLVPCDPREDRSWLQSTPTPFTDNCHALDKTGPNLDTPENWSEAVKRLKQRYLQRVIDAFYMDQCLIFCRTNFDCDNLEKFLNTLGGGGGGFRGKRESGKESPYSCVVLGGARSMEERRAALQAFKDGDVRFLICTDVAARGIDIQGLPYVINMTLPDNSEDYIHRVGRVGRQDTMGLAISLVSTVPEKVWYCSIKGYKPWLQPDAKNTKSNDQGGQTIWYDEQQLLQDIEKRLSRPIPALASDLSLPPDIAARVAGGGSADGATQYGQQRGGGISKEVMERVQAVRPAVQELSRLEFEAQSSFFALKRKWAAVA